MTKETARMSRLRMNLLCLLIPATLLLLACSLLTPGGPTPTPRAAATRTPGATPTPAPTRAKPTPAANTTTVPVTAPATGPYQITGHFTYSNDIITIYYVEQAVALVDLYGFVVRDEEWEIPVESQTMGYLKLDTGAME